MYDVEKRSAVLEDAAGFARRDAYMYGPVTKWRRWGMFIQGYKGEGSVRMWVPVAMCGCRKQEDTEDAG